MFLRRRAWWFVVLVISAIALIAQQVFFQAELGRTAPNFKNPPYPPTYPAEFKWYGNGVNIDTNAVTACNKIGASTDIKRTLIGMEPGYGYDNEVLRYQCLFDPPMRLGAVSTVSIECPWAVGLGSYWYTGGTHGVCVLNKPAPNSQLFSQDTKDALHKVSSDLRRVAFGGKIAKYICLVLAVPPTPATLACATFYVGFSAVTKRASHALNRLALDPPDPNYTVIQQPVFPNLPDLQAQPGLTQAAADAFNSYMKNQFQVIGFADAAYISYNRASGAINANDATWKKNQLEAANQYMQELANLLDAQPTWLTTLVNVLQRDGFPTITVSLDDARNFQSSVVSNGLPSDLIQTLQQLGADSEAIEEIRLFTIAQDPNSAQGNYPQKLIDQPLFDSLKDTAQKIRNSASPVLSGLL
ncbi:MAG: hypothetical protein N4J56_007907 [Chroococcidiopsis sp. SAG 2025]|uniref:hypothetical protein n=1 Tax=Chroococcidiopsis sp. SAG 2025 TaxID=171389 RepID=UPI002937241D|nr:hypothetical protein [Chroococcidiopsis sp. SAG 2025]MDV2998202.1 hypothetical protein [Chroococcidiopsis sp. SAG 2025]